MHGVTVTIGPEAVVVASDAPLRVLSSAVVFGGLREARAVVNLHVRKNDPCADPPAMLAAYCRRQGIPEPYVGLLTSTWTEHAVLAEERAFEFGALAVVTVGLSNRMAAGRAPATAWAPSTINTIVVVDAAPDPAAMVNAVITVTEIKALALLESGLVGPDGYPVTGTSTDAVVIAATGRGPLARFGGPASTLGWTIARAVRSALDRGIREWKERNP